LALAAGGQITKKNYEMFCLYLSGWAAMITFDLCNRGCTLGNN